MKRLFCLLMALLLLPILPALAEDQDEGALELYEILDWAQGYKTRAMAAQPLNDPNDEAFQSEDGYAFIYEFATLYMDRPEMSEESVLKHLVITSAEEIGPRGTQVDMFTHEVLAAFYNENPTLAGDRGFAALYVSDTMPMGALWGWVQRDGQQIMAIQYAVHDQLAAGGDGYTDAGVVYTIQENLVAAIRAYGLDTIIDEADVMDNLSTVKTVLEETAYTQVPVSYIGTDLDPFQASDLVFSGMDFASLTPEMAEAALGACLQDSWMEDDTGEFIRMMEFEGCEISFIYDKNKQNPVVDMLMIADGMMEGPRSVRLGDSFSSVLIRFRYNEGEYDGMRETLYGTVGTAPYGTAEYGDDASATLRYITATEDGREMTLCLNFTTMSLSEILLYTND